MRPPVPPAVSLLSITFMALLIGWLYCSLGYYKIGTLVEHQREAADFFVSIPGMTLAAPVVSGEHHLSLEAAVGPAPSANAPPLDPSSAKLVADLTLMQEQRDDLQAYLLERELLNTQVAILILLLISLPWIWHWVLKKFSPRYAAYCLNLRAR